MLPISGGKYQPTMAIGDPGMLDLLHHLHYILGGCGAEERVDVGYLG